METSQYNNLYEGDCGKRWCNDFQFYKPMNYNTLKTKLKNTDVDYDDDDEDESDEDETFLTTTLLLYVK